MALEHVLQMCHQHSVHDLEVEVDSLILVQMLQGKAVQPWWFRTHLVTIFSLMESTRCSLRHRYRETNSVADALAKLASMSQVTAHFQATNLPQRIKGLVRLDQQGVSYIHSK